VTGEPLYGHAIHLQKIKPLLYGFMPGSTTKFGLNLRKNGYLREKALELLVKLHFYVKMRKSIQPAHF